MFLYKSNLFFLSFHQLDWNFFAIIKFSFALVSFLLIRENSPYFMCFDRKFDYSVSHSIINYSNLIYRFLGYNEKQNNVYFNNTNVQIFISDLVDFLMFFGIVFAKMFYPLCTIFLSLLLFVLLAIIRIGRSWAFYLFPAITKRFISFNNYKHWVGDVFNSRLISGLIMTTSPSWKAK